MRRHVDGPYTYVVEPLPEEDGCGYVAFHPEFGRRKIFAFGDTPESAIAGLNTSRRLWLQYDGKGRNGPFLKRS